MDKCPEPGCNRNLSGCNEYDIALHMGFTHKNWSYLDAWYEKRGVPSHNRVHARLPLKQLLKPRFFVRKWKCACCDEPVLYDALEQTISCRCRTIKDRPVPLEELRKYWKPTILEASQ